MLLKFYIRCLATCLSLVFIFEYLFAYPLAAQASVLPARYTTIKQTEVREPEDWNGREFSPLISTTDGQNFDSVLADYEPEAPGYNTGVTPFLDEKDRRNTEMPPLGEGRNYAMAVPGAMKDDPYSDGVIVSEAKNDLIGDEGIGVLPDSRDAKTTQEQPIPLPDNSVQKIYWSFNGSLATDLNDPAYSPLGTTQKFVENDVPNPTGYGEFSSTAPALEGKALKLNGAELSGRINALDAREGGFSLSFWSVGSGRLPDINVTQVVDDVLAGGSQNFTTRKFDALSMSQDSDTLTIAVARPNVNSSDGTNDGTATQRTYSVNLNGALDEEGDHHIALVWNGEADGPNEGEIIDLAVIIDGTSFGLDEEGSQRIDGETLSNSDYYTNSQGDQIPASTLTISGSSVTIDEVRLANTILSPTAAKAFGASRYSSGEPLIAWDGLVDKNTEGNDEPYHNFSPIPNLGDEYDVPDAVSGVADARNDVMGHNSIISKIYRFFHPLAQQRSVSSLPPLEDGVYRLDGTTFLANDPRDFHIDDALAMAGWFKPEGTTGEQAQIFEVSIPKETILDVPKDAQYVNADHVTFVRNQGLHVVYNPDENQFEVTVQTANIERHEVRDEQDLRTALYAVLGNTIPEQRFEIVLTQSISLSHPLPSLVGEGFDGEVSKLARGTELILRGDEDSDIEYLNGQDAYQILVIDDDYSTFTFKDMGFTNGLAQGGVAAVEEGGGGGGLGAGGALFIAGGTVDIDNVAFSENQAVGGGNQELEGPPLKPAGSGGNFDTGKEEDKPFYGSASGPGGRLNENGDDLYYSAVTYVGAGGKGGNDEADGSGNSGNGDERNVGDYGDPGTSGGFGSGGGGGGGGQGGESDNDLEDFGGGGGPGGDGGFGAGGGGGGGVGGNEANTTVDMPMNGGAGGNFGAFSSSGGNGFSQTDSHTEEGTAGGSGAVGAGLGGAIFVANGTNLSGPDNQPQVRIAHSSFSGNKSFFFYDQDNFVADAIFIQDASSFADDSQDGNIHSVASITSIGWSNSSASNRIISTSPSDNNYLDVELPTESITFTYGSDEFNNSWHHVATSFADGDVPRLYLDGIPLTRTDDNDAIDLNPDTPGKPDLTPNRDGGFLPSDQSVARWGDVESIAGSFTGQVDGFRLYDRDLSPDEVLRSASANVTRVIVQLDNSTSGNTYDTAQYLFQSAGSASFNTVWLTLPKGVSVPSLQQGPGNMSWDDIKASLGDDFSLELVGQGNGNSIANFGDDNIETVPNQTDITLSGYSPTELQGSLLQMLPKGISTPKIFISTDNLIDPDTFLDDDHSGEKHLSAEEEPATLKFSEALMSVGLTENVNYVPLARVNSSGEIEFKSNDIWLQYDQVNEENPLSIELELKQRGAFSYLVTAYNVYDLIDKYKNFRVRATEAADTLLKQRTVTNSMSLLDDDGKTLSKFTAETKHKQGTAEKIYDAFWISEPKKVKLTSKTSKLPGFLTNTPVGATELELAGMGANPFQSTSIDSLRKQDDLSKAAQDIAKNNPDYAEESQQKDKNGFSKTSAALLTTGGVLYSLGSSISTFKDDDASTYEIAGASVKLVTGVALPIAEGAIESAVAAGVVAAGPAAPIVAAVAIITDIALFITNLIVSAVQEKKLRQEAIDFASDGFSDLINDLKSSFSDADDLYISGRFSGVAPEEEELTEEDVFVAVSSWLYQALLSAYDNNSSQLNNFIFNLSDDQKDLSVDQFIQDIQNNSVSLPDHVRKEFLKILELWTDSDSDELNNLATDIDLVSDSDMLFGSGKNDLRNALQQFVGERLDDGGENPDTDNVFTAGEALALDGSNIRNYGRSIAVYGLDDDTIREEVNTGKGNDTILLGLGEFNIQANDGNDTIFLSGGFKDVSDANNETKYRLDAGDMSDVSPVTQSLEDSDTVILEHNAFVNLTNVDGKQAAYFQGGSSDIPLFIHGVESAYGSTGNDQLISRAGKNSAISGNDGDDILATGYGVVEDAPDTQNITTQLDGGTGNDSLYGKHAGGLGYVALAGGAGNDILISDGGSISLNGGSGSDRLISSIDSSSETETVFVLGLDSGQDRIEKGLNAFDVTTNNLTELTFDFSDYQEVDNLPYAGAVLTSAENVQDILQFGEGISGKNLRVSQNDSNQSNPDNNYTIEGEVTFSLVADDSSILDSLIGDDLTKPNLQTGDAMTIAGNWNESGNYNHRIHTLRFGDGSRLDIGHIETWDTSGSIADDTVSFNSSNTFYQGFASNDTIISGSGHDVILPGSGDDTVTVGGGDQVLITRNPHDQDVITIEGDGQVTVALDGSIRLRDVGFAGENGADNNDNLTLTIGESGNLVGATQTIQINGAGGNLLLQFGTGFTLDLSNMDLSPQTKAGSNDNDNLGVSHYQGLLTGGFGDDTLHGSSDGTGNSILIGGGGSDILSGGDGDLFILGDQDGFDIITGGDGNNTILMVNTNTEVDQNFLLQRDKIWFIDKNTVDTLKGRNDLTLDPETIPTRPDGEDLEDDDLLIYIGDENNGALIDDWGNWNDDDRLVFTNQYSGAFEANKAGVTAMTPYMAQYIDLADLEDDIEENNQDTYSPWHADLGDGGSDKPTLQLNQDLYNLMLGIWSSASPVITSGDGFGGEFFDLPPEIDDQEFSLDPNASYESQIVGTVIASDPDGDDITFSINPANPRFEIDSNSGVVTAIPGASDWNPEEMFTVNVSDGYLLSRARVTVSLLDQPPEIESNQIFTTTNVVPDYYYVGSIEASDPDGDEIVFRMASENPHFKVSENGSFSVLNSTDLEVDTEEAFTVEVSDGFLSSTEVVKIRVAPNTPPILVEGQEFITYTGSAIQYREIGHIEAHDTENNITSYRVMDDSAFKMLSAPSNTMVVNDASLLVEDSDRIVTIQVSDSEPLSSEKTVVVHVVENEEPEVEEYQEFTASANATQGTVIGTIQASDPLGDELTFTITGQDFPVFVIEPHSGVLKVDNFSEDYGVSPNATKKVKVRVSDGVFDKIVQVRVLLE